MTDAGPPWTDALDGIVASAVSRLAHHRSAEMVILAVPGFPAERRREEEARIEVADEIVRRLALADGRDRWSTCSVGWEAQSAADDYGVSTAEVVAALDDTGRRPTVVVLPVGLRRPPLPSAQRLMAAAPVDPTGEALDAAVERAREGR